MSLCCFVRLSLLFLMLSSIVQFMYYLGQPLIKFFTAVAPMLYSCDWYIVYLIRRFQLLDDKNEEPEDYGKFPSRSIHNK